MSLRAYYEQESTNGVVDRIEIHDSQFSGDAFQFEGDDTGFSFSHSEITSESTAKLLNVHANPIQKGRLDFRPRIASDEGFSLLEDIRDATDGRRFHIVHKEDGSFAWCGYITSKVFQYPERDNNFVSHVRAIDFEWMEGDDYTLDDTRQTLIQTIADLLSGLPEDVKIKTATSWITEQTTDSTDFLGQVFHETKALRDFAKADNETDQPIKVWGALHHMAEPGLLIRQHKGFVFIDQLTELDDPANVHETIYNADGSVDTATTTVDRRQTGYKSADDGTPSIKVSSQNHTYPAIKQATATYDHRTKVTNIQPTGVRLTDDAGETSFSDSQLFLSDGSQRIEFNLNVLGSRDGPLPSSTGEYYLKAGPYYWDEEEYEWTENGGNILWNEYELTNTTNKPELTIWIGGVGFETDHTPPDADGELEFEVEIPSGLTQSDISIVMDIINPIASENSTSINYQLTQIPDYPSVFELEDTWFGDGPVQWSVGALRHGTANNDTTTDDWQRRGSASYRNYHENLLKEILDLQRTPCRKIQANIYGDYDPSKVLVYDGSHFYYAGGNYDGTIGRWTVTLFEVNIETASDDFDDIPKFSGDTDSGTGASSNDPTTGNFNPSTYDNRWFNIQNDLAEGDSDAIKSTLDLVVGTDVQAWDADLDAIDQDLSTTATPTWPQATITNAPTTNDQIATKGYADSLISGLDWQESVIDEINDPSTVTPSGGDRYLVGESPVGDFSGHAEEIAEYDGSDWVFIIPDDATTLEIESNGFIWIWNGSNWVRFGSSISHNQLQDLDASDHLINENDTGLAFFNASQDQFDTDADLTFDGNALGAPSLDITSGDFDDHLRIERGSQFFTVTIGLDNTARFGESSSDIDSFGFGQPVIVGRQTIPSGFSGELYVDGAAEVRATLDVGGMLSVDVGETNVVADLRSTDTHSDIILRDGNTTEGRAIRRTGENLFLVPFDGNVAIGTTSMSDSETLRVNGETLLEDALDVGGLATFSDDIQTDNFSSGFTGAGLQATHSGDVTAGSILLRDSLRARELIFDQLGAVGGSQLISNARGKIESVDTGNSEVTLEDLNGKDATSFATDDIFWAVAWDVDGAEIISATGTVTSITNTTLTLSFDSGAIGDLSAGDVIVQRGNTTDADRQSLIYQTASDADAPFTSYYQNVDAVADFAPSNVFAQIGVLDNLNTEHGVSGDGVFVSRGFFTEQITVGDLTKTDNYLDYQGANLILDTDDAFIKLGGAMEIDSGIGIDVGTDFWHNDQTFQLGGSDGITYDGTNPIALGTDTVVRGNLDAVTFTGGSASLETLLGVGSTTFGNEGVQLDYNSGTPRAHIGDSTNYFLFEGGVVNLEAGNASIGDDSGWFGASDVLAYNSDGSVDVAGFTADSARIQAGAVGTGLTRLMSDNTGEVGPWNGTPAGVPTLANVLGSDTADRIFVHMGETYSEEWTGRYGFSLGQGKSTEAIFEISVDMATSDLTGTIAGLDLDEGSLVTGDGDLNDGYTAGTVTGLQPRENDDTRVLFGGADNEDGDGASFYATADGRLFYDAMTQVVYSRTEIADLDTINPDGASPIDDSSWNMSVDDGSTTGGGATNITSVVRAGYVHRGGLNKIEVSGFYDFESTINDEGEASLQVFIAIGGAQTGQQIIRSETTDVSVSDVSFHEVFDISSFGLNDNEAYIVRCAIVLEADLTSGQNALLTSSIREDLVILATT